MITRQECASPWTYPTDGTTLIRGKYEVTVIGTDNATEPATATATASANMPAAKT